MDVFVETIDGRDVETTTHCQILRVLEFDLVSGSKLTSIYLVFVQGYLEDLSSI